MIVNIDAKMARFAAAALRDWMARVERDWRDLENPPDDWDWNDIGLIDIAARALDKVGSSTNEGRMVKPFSVTYKPREEKVSYIEISGPFTVKLDNVLRRQIETAIIEELTALPLANLSVEDGSRVHIKLCVSLADCADLDFDLHDLLDDLAEHYTAEAKTNQDMRRLLQDTAGILRECAEKLESACK